MVRAEVQPWSGVPIRAQTMETAPTVALTAPTTSNRPGRRGVSVTNIGASTSTAMPIGTLMNSVQRQEATSVSNPPRSSPMEAPPEETAPNRASARLRSPSSRAPVVSRASTLGAAIAAPTPCRARAAMSSSVVGASPPRSEASDEQREARLEDAQPTAYVAQPAAEEQQAAEREGVGVEDPAERGRAEVEVRVDARESDVHDRRVEHQHQLGDEDDEDAEAGPVGRLQRTLEPTGTGGR